jgi:pre-mRNA-splicing factor SYF1
MEELFCPPDEGERSYFHNPYSCKSWWNSIQVVPVQLFKQRSRLYERALGYIPGSYKLWYHYTSEAANYAINVNPTEAARNEVEVLYERSLRYMYPMPRIWLDYIRFLIDLGKITKTRKIFDLSLTQLPITQHDRIWDLYIAWAETHPVPETARRVYLRYLPTHPEFLEDYLEFLVGAEYYREASRRLYDFLKDDSVASYQGKDKREYWAVLCALIAKNPDELDFDGAEVLSEALHQKPLSDGKIWQLMAEFYTRKGDMDKARAVFEEALTKVSSEKDFGVVFGAYSNFEESLMAVAAEDGEEEELRAALERAETLANRRDLLLSNVMIRQAPNTVQLWENRVRLYPGNLAEMLKVYSEAVKVIDPVRAEGKIQRLWIRFARLYEEAEDLSNAREVLYQATLVKYRRVEDLADIWREWVEMEIRQRQYDTALKVISHVCNKKYAAVKSEGSPQDQISGVTMLWCLYADLEESIGTIDSTKAVYKRMLSLKLATAQIVLNYANFLQEHNYYEEAFRVYEQGVQYFSWPHLYDIWVSYLVSFVKRYEGTKLERARDLFEQVIKTCPKDKIAIFYHLYAKLEQDYGLINHAIEVYDKAVRDVPDKEKVEILTVYMQKACDFFGIGKARKLYETAFEYIVIPEDVLTAGLHFANIEKKLGEIDRSRAIYQYISQYCDPRVETNKEFWSSWYDFEVYHGNEMTFREMMRTKRTINLKFNGVGPFVQAADPTST